MFSKIENKLKKIYTYLYQNKFRRRILKRMELVKARASTFEETDFNFDSSTPMETWTSSNKWPWILENKWNAKEFASKMECRVSTLYWMGKREEFLDLKSLPANYVIKPVVGKSSQNIFLMHEGFNLLDGKEYSTIELRNALNDVFDSETEILVEEFLPNAKGEYVIPIDYKFFTFNGNITFIEVISRSRHGKAISFYNEDWKYLKKKIIKNVSAMEEIAPPKDLKEMIYEVKKLSEAYERFVRIDFYDSPRGPVFGEFTPTPRQGYGFTRYGNRKLINDWNKYCKDSI